MCVGSISNCVDVGVICCRSNRLGVKRMSSVWGRCFDVLEIFKGRFFLGI